MTNVFKRAENEEFIIKMVQDECLESPRTAHDNLATMVCWHSRYNLGDEHSYSDVEDFLQSLAEDSLETEVAKQIIEKKVAEQFSYVVGQIEEDEENIYILIPKSALEAADTLEFRTVEEAKDAVHDMLGQLISDEFTGENHWMHVQKTLTGKDVMDEVRQKVERMYAYEVVKIDNSYFMMNMKNADNKFQDEEFDTAEEAEERLEEEKDTWVEDELLEELSNDELLQIIKEDNVILPLYLYDHSGLTMNTTGFSCGWDSSVVGFIYCSKKDFRSETGYSEEELFSEEVHRAPSVYEHVKVKGQEDRGYGRVKKVTEETVTIDFDYMKIPSFRKEENLITVSLEDIASVQANKAEEMLKGEVETYDQYLRGDVYGFVVEKKVGCECCGHVETEEVDSCWGFFGSDPIENGMKDNLSKEYHPLLEQLRA